MSQFQVVKLTTAERDGLRRLAQSSGDTVSGLLREALYSRYGVGDWSPCSSLTASSGITAR